MLLNSESERFTNGETKQSSLVKNSLITFSRTWIKKAYILDKIFSNEIFIAAIVMG